MQYKILLYCEKVNIITLICQYNNVIIYYLYLANYILIIISDDVLLDFLTNATTDMVGPVIPLMFGLAVPA